MLLLSCIALVIRLLELLLEGSFIILEGGIDFISVLSLLLSCTEVIIEALDFAAKLSYVVIDKLTNCRADACCARCCCFCRHSIARYL